MRNNPSSIAKNWSRDYPQHPIHKVHDGFRLAFLLSVMFAFASLSGCLLDEEEDSPPREVRWGVKIQIGQYVKDSIFPPPESLLVDSPNFSRSTYSIRMDSICYYEPGCDTVPRTVKCMSKNLDKALKETLQGIVNVGLPTTFTEKQLNELGIRLPTIEMSANKVKKIRRTMKLSQSVFAQLLNVSITTVRNWEQGARKPSGSTKVLLDLLSHNPHALDYLLPEQLIAA